MNKLNTDYYIKYVGQYAKRFYNAFEAEEMAKIIGYLRIEGILYFVLQENGKYWKWDVEDCVIITNETPIIEDERVANINHKEYKGWDPFNERNIK